MLLLGVAVVAADRLARRVSQPIQDVVRAADAMREGSLDVRVAEEGMPEVVTLARALNLLAERVGRLLAAERNAVADLSHRLRTPVTALRLDTEMITDPDVGERLRGHITQLERTVDAIVHDARRTSRTDAVGACDAAKVVRDRVAFWSALAEEQGTPAADGGAGSSAARQGERGRPDRRGRRPAGQRVRAHRGRRADRGLGGARAPTARSC